MVDFPDASVKCPYVGFKQPCRDLALSCPKFVHIAGTNPNTGDPVNKYGCADSFVPMLLIENSQQQRQTGAAVESFRNAVVAINGRTLEQIAHPSSSEDGLRRTSVQKIVREITDESDHR